MTYGYAGTILWIDLSERSIKKTRTSEYAGSFLGGRGINARLMFDNSKPGVSAFAPDNPIIIGAGPLVGTGIIGAVRYEITTRSPEQVPEGFGNVGSGGSFGPEMKYAGYDHIVIKGKAEKPTYVYIENDEVSFKDASALWGKGIFETNRLIREELGDPEVAILAIGQAGENLVRIATIEHEYRSGTALGAPVGAKNLKAIVVRGTKGLKVFDPEKILEINQEIMDGIKDGLREHIQWCKDHKKPYLPYPKYCVGVEAVDEYFDQTDKAFTGYCKYEWADLDKTRGAPFLNKRMVKQSGCCPLACIGIVKVPGIGTCAMKCDPFWWPWQLYLTDLDNAFEAVMLCSDYGIDNQGIATPVSWLMKLYEEGIITAKDTDGVPMEWGSSEALIHTIHSVAKRKGFGDILADGVLSLAGKLGQRAGELLLHRRGVVANSDEMRTQPAVALGTALDTTCGRENWYTEVIWERLMRGEGEGAEIKDAYARAKKTYGTEKVIDPLDYEGKAAGLIVSQNDTIVTDMYGICLFASRQGGTSDRKTRRIGEPRRVVWPSELAMYRAATGLDYDEEKLRSFAERVFNLEKAYNVREGHTREDEKLEEYWFKVPIPDGPYKGMKLDKAGFEKAEEEYYRLRGWDPKTGWPARQTYKRLGLNDVADSLQKLGKLPELC